MSIISKETFEKFTEEEKDKVIHDYQIALTTGNGRVVHELENLFGKENLQPEPKIKTWEDLEKEGFSVKDDYLREFDYYDLDKKAGGFTDAISYKGKFSDNLIDKAIATLKIAKLIELGYGGMVTDEEWKDRDIIKYCITRVNNDWMYSTRTDHFQFIAFHTQQQAEKFMSYPENVELVEQYYMV